ADVRQVRNQLQLLDERLAGRPATVDTEGEDGAGALRQVLLRQAVVRVVRQARVADPTDGRMIVQHLGNGERVLAVALHPQRQGLQAEQQQEGVERREAGPDVAQRLAA